jgi:hypothetical protein
MALLEKAKKASEKKDEHKKKHKHPAAKAEAAPSPEPEEEAGDADAEQPEGGDQDQPDAESDDSGSEGPPQGGEAPGAAPDQGAQQGGDQDQDASQGAGDQDGGGQNVQQGGAQGGSPVPSPAAPGAGDTTSGGADTPPQGQGDTGGEETPGEDTAAGPGSTTDLQQVPMSPGLKDEYDKANDLLMQLLYKSGDDKLATGLVQGLMPQGPGKIKNAALLAIQVVVQIHKKMNLPPQIILPFAKDVTAHVMNLGEQVKQIQYSDQESTAILASVYEGALRIFGVSKGTVKTFAQHLGKNVLQSHQQKYLAAHAHAKPAIDKNNQDWHHPHLAPQQGAPQTAGPQTGAPVGAQSSPQSGAPPTPPAPPATPEQGAASGGMLNQAAQGAQ